VCALGLGLGTNPLEALGTDAVRRLPDDLLREACLAAPDRVELEPLVADLELAAPRAVDQQPPT
jgi:hypothetical protein